VRRKRFQSSSALSKEGIGYESAGCAPGTAVVEVFVDVAESLPAFAVPEGPWEAVAVMQ